MQVVINLTRQEVEEAVISWLKEVKEDWIPPRQALDRVSVLFLDQPDCAVKVICEDSTHNRNSVAITGEIRR